jgi:hypothetical protein
MIRYIPAKGDTFERDGRVYRVTRVNEDFIFFNYAEKPHPGGFAEGIDYWNAKQGHGMATLRDLGHR